MNLQRTHGSPVSSRANPLIRQRKSSKDGWFQRNRPESAPTRKPTTDREVDPDFGARLTPEEWNGGSPTTSTNSSALSD